MKPLFSILLILLLLSLSLLQKTERIYPFVPPLTHTPQMSLASIGIPPPPIRVLLPELELISQSSCYRCATLQAQHQEEAENGQRLRLNMQAQVQALISELPPHFIEQARHHRSLNSQRIGEVWVWEQLSKQD